MQVPRQDKSGFRWSCQYGLWFYCYVNELWLNSSEIRHIGFEIRLIKQKTYHLSVLLVTIVDNVLRVAHILCFSVFHIHTNRFRCYTWTKSGDLLPLDKKFNHSRWRNRTLNNTWKMQAGFILCMSYLYFIFQTVTNK